MHNAISSLPSGMKTSSRLSLRTFSSLSRPYVPRPRFSARLLFVVGGVTEEERPELPPRALLISRYTFSGHWDPDRRARETEEGIAGIPGQDRRRRNVREIRELAARSVTKREGKSEGSGGLGARWIIQLNARKGHEFAGAGTWKSRELKPERERRGRKLHTYV